MQQFSAQERLFYTRDPPMEMTARRRWEGKTKKCRRRQGLSCCFFPLHLAWHTQRVSPEVVEDFMGSSCWTDAIIPGAGERRRSSKLPTCAFPPTALIALSREKRVLLLLTTQRDMAGWWWRRRPRLFVARISHAQNLSHKSEQTFFYSPLPPSLRRRK